ncbi:MAG: hypothetical protein BGO78_07005 [Chloroflexi bacterium 44-23]|nr:MAG: hypothetical protein BGO78_07005 [Chloroflexi bacterium 44-23]
MSSITYTQKSSLSNWQQFLITLLGGAISGFVLVLIFLVGYQIWFAGKIFPGVSVAQVNLGGLTPQEAATLLKEKVTFPQQGHILLRDGEQTWLLTPEQLGLFFDPEGTATQALVAGREGGLIHRLQGQWSAWQYGKTLAPVFILDKRVAYAQLNQLSSVINRPVIEADLSITGIDVVVNAGQIGRYMDIDATISQIAALMHTLRDGEVNLVITETQPYIMDASAQAKLARNILSQPLKLTAENATGSPWELDPEVLAGMLRIERIKDENGSFFQVGLNTEALRDSLAQLAPQLQISPENARYIFNDDTRELDVIKNAIIGRQLNIEDTIAKIQSTIVEEGSHEIGLVFDTTLPELTDDLKGADVGITELLISETSYFYGSSADRVQNIAVAASKFHGLMIPPGATFSMASALGDISLDNGYAEALIIAGGQTITGVGGGVCQVSTTLFRTAFFAGFPIVERYSHAYRVSYYERVAGGGIDPRLAGLDATVYVPVVDLKFTNNSPYWILMETYVNPSYSSIQWKFYSTSDGRSVNWTTTGPVNLVEPPEPKYKENPDLPEGKIKQVDWAAQGADVTVNRTVNRNGEVLFSDQFFTHYQPWQAVFEYGPGTEIPKPSSEN